jgi:polar amino acid transport system substrate-binding protein
MKLWTCMQSSLPFLFKRVVVFVFCLVYCLISAPGSNAEHRTLKTAVFHARPYGFIGENGGMQGLSVDQIKAIMTEAKLPYEMFLGNFSRILHELRLGKVDMAILLWSDAALEVAECIETSMELNTIVVGRKGTNWSSVTDLHELQQPVGTSRGAKYGDRFDDDTAIPKYPIDRYEQGLQMLFAGRLDAIVGTERAIFKAARDLGYSRDQFGVPLVIKEVKGCIYFSRTTAPYWSQPSGRRSKTLPNASKKRGYLNRSINGGHNDERELKRYGCSRPKRT